MLRLAIGCDTSRTSHRALRVATACILGCTLVLPPAFAQASHARFAVTSSQVVSAMAGRGLPTENVQVQIAAPITTLVEAPHLEILSITPATEHAVRLRVGCRNHADCLVFFATATWPGLIDTSKLSTAKPEQATLNAPNGNVIKQAATVAKPAAAPANSAESSNTAKSAEPPLFKNGSPATLEIDEDRIHIHLDVICLGAGSVGDKVRVTTRDHKQTYMAEIVTPTLLKGSL